MDNSPGNWGPKPELVGIASLLAVAAAVGTVWFAVRDDRPGAILLGVGTLALAAVALHGALVRPRLTADRDGIGVRTTGRLRWAPWSLVHTRLTSSRRLGRDSTTLEVEIDPAGDDPQLVVLGWLELGADPDDVFAELNHIRGR